MQNEELLNQIAKHFDEHAVAMRSDIKELDQKLDNYQERLIKVESTLGFIKVGFNLVMTAITGIISYLGYKYLDSWNVK